LDLSVEGSKYDKKLIIARDVLSMQDSVPHRGLAPRHWDFAVPEETGALAAARLSMRFVLTLQR
jgi:hypothetical protein